MPDAPRSHREPTPLGAKPLSGMDVPILRLLINVEPNAWTDSHTIGRELGVAGVGSRLNSLAKRGLIVKSSDAKGYWAITREGQEALADAPK